MREYSRLELIRTERNNIKDEIAGTRGGEEYASLI